MKKRIDQVRLASKKSGLFYWKIFRDSFSKFAADDIFTHGAALSYYTIFSLPPMLLIILYSTAWFFEEAVVKEALFNQIGQLVGRDGASQLLIIIERIQVFEPSIWATILSGLVLVFTSTTVFITLQNALNKIFGVKSKPEGWGILKMVRDRVLSFTLVLGIAFILLVSLAVNAFVDSFGKYLEEVTGIISIFFAFVTNTLLPLFIISILFAMMFKFLPDVKLAWKHTWFGAILTSFLFVIGKNAISFYIGNSDIAGLYNTAGSIMVIMVWVFYASLILMYGAVFTDVYMRAEGDKIKALDFAVKVEYKEIEKPEIGKGEPKVADS